MLQNTNQDRTILSDEAYRLLEERILFGRWRPSVKISLRTLADSLGMSVQPVRDAVSRLIALLALETTPGRSVRVPSINRQSADEIWAMRILLEGEAVALMARNRSPDDLERLTDLTDRIGAVDWVTQGDENIGLMMAWNRALAGGAQSNILAGSLVSLQLRYAPFLADCLAKGLQPGPDFLSFTIYMQKEIVYAVRSQDEVAASYLRRADLKSFQRWLYTCQGWEL